MTNPPPQPAIVATGLRKSYGDKVVLDGIDLEVAEGTIFSLLGPNGAGKTTMVQILSTLIGADGGEVRVAGHDLAREPDAVRAAIGVTGQYSAVDKLLTGEENLILMADLHHLGKVEGRRRAAELLEQFDLVEAATKTAATYSGGMRRRLDLAMTLVGRPAHHLPRRADHRPGPAQPAHHVADHPRSRRERGHDLPHDAVPGRGRRARRPDRAPRPRKADRRGHRGRTQTPHPRRPYPSAVHRLPADFRSAAAPSVEVSRDDDELTLHVPSDGSVRSLRALLARLDDNSIEVEEMSVHTPDLDDVFLALTGANPRRTAFDEHPLLRRARLGDDAAPQPPAHAALPVHDADARRHAGDLPAAIRLRLRRHPGRRARRRLGRTRRIRQLRDSRNRPDGHRRRRHGNGRFGVPWT